MKINLFSFSFFFFLIAICSCSGNYNSELPNHSDNLKKLKVYPSNLKPKNVIELIPEQKFGDTETLFFKRIARFDVGDRGRVYIPKDSIIVFESDGSYFTSISDQGKGPGEFQTIANLYIDKQNLFVYDSMSKRVTIINLKTSDPVNEFNLSLVDNLSTKGIFLVINDTTLLVEYENLWAPNLDRFKYLYRVNTNDATLIEKESILKQEIRNVFRKESDGRFQQGVFPFSRSTINTISSDDKVYSANTENILVKIYNKNGQYLRSFYHDFDNVQIDYNKFFNQVDNLDKSDLPNFDFPETWPAVYSMVMDDQDRIWLSTIVENDKVYEWWVLSKEGELLAQFRWSRSKEIKVVKNDKVYALEENSETGVDSIVRYKMILSPNNN